jgi:hypothetical protein
MNFRKKLSFLLAIIPLMVIFTFSPVIADERDKEIADLKVQVQGLLKRIEALEQEQTSSKEAIAKQKEAITKQEETIAKKTEPSVLMDKLISKLKLKGRWAAGYYKSGKAGSYTSGSFEVPEAKLVFAFEPDEINKITLRFNLNNGSFNSVDYSYLDTNLAKFFNLPMPLNSRIGRLRIDFGEEYSWNNPVEGVLTSNSAPNVDGKDEGFQLLGKIGKTRPLGYVFSVTNGNSGTGSDTSAAKSFTGKLYYNIFEPLYISASYYNSGTMKGSNTEIAIAGLTARPGNAAKWSRQIWEVDMRYDYQKGKTLYPPAYSDSKAIIQLSYGGFSDAVTTTPALGGAKRIGTFGFIEGTYNLTKKFYMASRASFLDLNDDTIASLNNINCHRYTRYSLGGGYRLTGNTIFKLAYDWNIESGPGVSDADNNLLSVVMAAQF